MLTHAIPFDYPEWVEDPGEPSDTPVTDQIQDTLDDLNGWLRAADRQLSFAQKLFKGGELSAVAFDPVGYLFPRDWYCHYLRYQPGVGIVKGNVNRNHVAPGDCVCDKCTELRLHKQNLALNGAYSSFIDFLNGPYDLEGAA